MTLRVQPWRGLAEAAIAGLSLLVGGILGLAACDPCNCGEPRTIHSGTYDIVESSFAPELVGGTLQIDGGVEIEFTDGQGADWVVTYERPK